MQKSDGMNIVINFHKGDQVSAKLLLELLMVLDEGVECVYHLQYGDNTSTLLISETLLKFLSRKKAHFSVDLPDIKLPHKMIHEDPNLVNYGLNNWCLPRSRKFKIFSWNLTVFKYLHSLDFFLMMEPDSVVLKHGWLKEIHEAWRHYDGPIFGHLKKGKIKGDFIPTHWAGSSVYDCVKLRELPLEKYFYERYPNPWWPFREEKDTSSENNCFWGPMFSGYDVSYDYFLFGLYWREKTGSNNPYDWPLSNLVSREDLIFCDWSSKLNYEMIIKNYLGKLCVFHGQKEDSVRQSALKIFLSGRTIELRNIPPGGPDTNPLKDNLKFVNIGDLKDRFKDQRCFIIGNGPSLNQTVLTYLKNEYTIGMNRIYLNYHKMGFEPTFYCSVNPNVIEQFKDDIDKVDSIKFVRKDASSYIKNRWNIFFMKSLDHFGLNFNANLETLEWYEGGTVTYCALQVAFYLGFQAVILIGVDHFFKESGEPNKLVTASGDDPNHFHPDYFGKGIKWQFPDLDRSEQAYQIAKRVYEENGRVILDATVGGHLKVFPKVDYMTLFSNIQLETHAGQIVLTNSGLLDQETHCRKKILKLLKIN